MTHNKEVDDDMKETRLIKVCDQQPRRQSTVLSTNLPCPGFSSNHSADFPIRGMNTSYISDLLSGRSGCLFQPRRLPDLTTHEIPLHSYVYSLQEKVTTSCKSIAKKGRYDTFGQVIVYVPKNDSTTWTHTY